MSIGEFEEVGNTVKAFASENATVVVGTVIDPEMSGDLRVTVVATGIGSEKTPERVVPNSIKIVKKNDGQVDYDQLERPTVIRNQVLAQEYSPKQQTAEARDMDYLDIPAFLRRQAD